MRVTEQPTTSDGEGLTPLHLAAISGNLTVLSVLGTNTPELLDSQDTQGHSALHWAVVCGQASRVRLLCDQGAQVGLADSEGGTPLHYAAMVDNTQVLDTLLEAGASPGLEDKAGRTAVSWAASSGGLSSFLRLVKRHPEAMSQRDAQSLTPLHCAAALGQGDIIASVGQGQTWMWRTVTEPRLCFTRPSTGTLSVSRHWSSAGRMSIRRISLAGLPSCAG